MKKKWHRIPTVMVLVTLTLVLSIGIAVAADEVWGFFTGKVQAETNEAIAVGAFGTWDNLHPYGSDSSTLWEDSGLHNDPTGTLGDIRVSLGGTPEIPIISITHSADTPYEGEGFVAGEWIVIPLNIRNGSTEALTLSASVGGTGSLEITASFELNNGEQTAPIPSGHEGQYLAYDYKATGVFSSLSGWEVIVEGNSGFSGSAVYEAQVLFVKIAAPGNIAPGTHTLDITLNRS